MPREQFGMIFTGISFMYFFEMADMSFYKFFELSAWMSKGGWFVAMLGFYAVFAGAEYWYLRRAGEGKVAANGLEGEKGGVIPFGNIERVVREGGGFPAVVFTANDQEKMHLAGSEFIKLTKTSLNRWEVKGEKVIVTHGEEGREPQIVYAPRGRYSTYRLWILEAFIVCILSVAGGFLFVFGWDTFAVLWACFIGYPIVFIVPHYYRRVKVLVEGDKVVMKRGKKEESFRFGDVAGIEKGLFQVKVTAKDGNNFFFPRGCILLPEIIEEFAGLARR